MPSASVMLLSVLVLAVALLYSTVGHAGASGYLAVMALTGVAPEVMRPISLSLNIIVATITTIRFMRAGHFSWPLFWPFALASIPAAALGGAIALPADIYRPLVGIVLLFSAWRLATARTAATDPDAAEPQRPPRLPVSLGVGAVLGLLSGLSGTGGGIFLSPVLLLCGWASVRRTAAVSAAFILVNSIAGLAGLVVSGQPIPQEAYPMFASWSIAVVIGGLVGSYLGAHRLGTITLRRLLALVLVVAGAKLVLQSV